MKAIRIYAVAACIIASTTFADATPVMAEPVAVPFQSLPKPPPPPDPLHLFSKKRAHRRAAKRTRKRSTLHIKLPPHPPAPPRPRLP